MYKRVSHSRAAVMGLLFAMVAFSYALATSNSLSLRDGGASTRAVGSATLKFTNPLAAAPLVGRDLGDAALGSSVTRYVRATGGVRPYKFVSTVTPTLKEAITGTTSTLDLLQSGLLFGSLGNIAITASPINFNVTVIDNKATNPNSKTERFFLFLDNSGIFKFASSSLCDGIKFQAYVDILQVLNGNAPFTFTATTVTFTPAGSATAAAKTSLEDTGLTISALDGVVFGIPFEAGTITFTANCKDVRGNDARSRSGATTGQVTTVTVADNQIISSDFITTGLQIKVDTAAGGKDSIKFACLANLGGTAISALRNALLELRVNGYISPNTTATPGTLDDKGKTIKPSKLVSGAALKSVAAAAKSSAPTFKGSVNSKGQIKIAVAKESIGTRLGTMTGSTKNLAVGLRLGNILSSAEIMQAELKTKGTQSSLTFKSGKTAPLAGTFMLTSVKGKDDKSTAAVAFKASFIGQAPASASIQGVSSATVNVGESFTDTISVSESKNKVKSTAKVDSKSEKVTKVAFDGLKGKGSVTTGFLTTAKTGIVKAASAAGKSTTFPMNLSLSTTTVKYFGEGSITIFPKKTSYSEKNPSK